MAITGNRWRRDNGNQGTAERAVNSAPARGIFDPDHVGDRRSPVPRIVRAFMQGTGASRNAEADHRRHMEWRLVLAGSVLQRSRSSRLVCAGPDPADYPVDSSP